MLVKIVNKLALEYDLNCGGMQCDMNTRKQDDIA